MKRLLFLSFFFLLIKPCFSQKTEKEVIYKTVDSKKLKMKLYYPLNYKVGTKYPTIILFFGGGWNGGTIDQFLPQAKHFASLGMIAVLADYRVFNRQKTTPFESVMDAKSAIRYLRKNATELGINPNKIAAGGGSAGGHLAAAADLTSINQSGEDTSISAKPNALVLFNPVFNNGPNNYGYERFGDRYIEISPYHNIKKGAAPTIVFLGTKDNLIPVKTAELYRDAMLKIGSRCDLYLYDGQGHGFFNLKDGDDKYYKETLDKSVVFLKSLGYIK